MTIEKARSILGEKYSYLSDEQIDMLIFRLDMIAKIAAENAIREFDLEKCVESKYSDDVMNNFDLLYTPSFSRSDSKITPTAI